jgi:eukaryotic-like serine/threonine-protein kinase
MSIPSGAKLGYYEIRSLLGEGGMGEVYLADDLRLHRPVALKLLRADLAADEDRLLRFKREAYTASSLNHPNILTIYEFGREDEYHFIVSEFIDGESLSRHIQREPFQLQDVLEIGIQVASALAAAHAAGIVHRDIKPDNIMLRSDRLVKVVDFGIAKLSEQQDAGSETAPLYVTAPGKVIGTAPYMSPEQVRGLPVDTRTDIWSLGVVLYQMVGGQLPFTGRTMTEVIAEILKTEPPVLTFYVPNVPAELERIVSKALRKDREERYQVVKDLGLDLKTLKQRMEFEAELERSGSRVVRSGEVSRGVAEADLTEANATRILGTPVDSAVSKAQTTSSAEYVVSEIRRHKRGLTLALLVIIAAIAGAGWWLYSFISRLQLQSRSTGTAFEITPFTSLPGDERVPSFSPDGNRIAFSWNGEQGDNTDIYVKQIGTEDLQRLTTNPAADIQARWSPDGLYIAFLRQTAENYGLYLMPSIGGKERLLTNISLVPPTRFAVAQVSWSPNGEWLAVSDKGSPQEPYRIFMVERDSGERRRLTSPPTESTGDLSPAVSPDGKMVAYKHFESGGVSEIYLVPVAGGEPRRLTSSDVVKLSPAWTPDGRDILFLSESGTPERVGAVGQTVLSFDISPQGNRLAWAQTVSDSNIWQVELSGEAARKASAKVLISSTKADVSSQFSPDGNRIVFASTRSGRSGIWISDSDGQHQVQLAAFAHGAAGSPRWSFDGRWIVFDGRVEGNADIYVINPEGGKPRRLTTERSEDVVPSCSRDGQWIYFSSNRSGVLQIWKMPAAGGQAVQVTRGGGFDSVESPDGKFLYYAKERGEPGIWRVPVPGGEETPVLDHHRAGLWRQWAVVEQGIFFITAETPDRPLIEFFSFTTGKASLVMTIEKRVPDTISGLSVSPDGRRLIWTQLDQITSDIMLMNNFR